MRSDTDPSHRAEDDQVRAALLTRKECREEETRHDLTNAGLFLFLHLFFSRPVTVCFGVSSPKFTEDIDSLWDYRKSIEQYEAMGGTSKQSVMKQIRELRVWLQGWSGGSHG